MEPPLKNAFFDRKSLSFMDNPSNDAIFVKENLLENSMQIQSLFMGNSIEKRTPFSLCVSFQKIELKAE